VLLMAETEAQVVVAQVTTLRTQRALEQQDKVIMAATEANPTSKAASNLGPGANGGAGSANTIETGSSITYATGGRGGDELTNAGGATGGANTGDGGGGGLSGGSGIVIIRYAI
jgi:hypothetical protein